MALLLMPGQTSLSTAGQLAETAVTYGTNQTRFAYFQLVRALADFRRGRFATAVDWSHKTLACTSTNFTTAVAAEAVRAMAQQKLEQTANAAQSLAHATEIFKTKLPQLESGDLGEDWPEWLIAHILLREAKALIEK
jgi:hypothetical protein